MQEIQILIVEDSLVTALAAERVLSQALPGARIFRAQGCFEAHLLVQMYDIELFLVDVHLPDGCGLDLIQQILGVKPTAKIIVMTADRAQELQDRASAFGVEHVLLKPFTPGALGKAARRTINHGQPEEQPGLFTAVLNRLSVLEIVQLKCQAGATTRLDVSSHTYHHGSIHLADGEIIHGEVRDEFSRLLVSGEPALAHILGWPGGSVKEATPAALPERSISEPWQSLLLTVAHRCDERFSESLRHSEPVENQPVGVME